MSIPHVLASMETVARWIAQIVEAYSREGGRLRWAGVHHYEGRTSAMDCIDPNLRAAVAKKTREELDLENLRGKFTGVTGTGRQSGAATGAGDGADGEGTLAAKGGSQPETADSRPGGSDAMTVNQAGWTGDDRWPNQVPGRRLRCCVRYHLSVTPDT